MPMIYSLQKASIVLLFVLAVITADATETTNQKRPVAIDDYDGIVDVADPQLSPDGKSVAYVSGDQVWIVPASSGPGRAVTPADSAASDPSWSIDGQWLYFLSDRSGSSQLWKLPLAMPGEAVQVAALDLPLHEIVFSPDQSALLISHATAHDAAAREGRSEPWVIDRLQFKEDEDDGYITGDLPAHLYRYDIASGDLDAITSGKYEETEAAWSPDGRSVVFVSNREEEPDADYSSDIWRIAADGSADSLVRLTTGTQTRQLPAWSPDGRNIAFISAVDGVYGIQHLAVVPADGGDVRILTEQLDRWVSDFRFSADGRWIYFLYDESGAVHLARVNLQSGKIETLIGSQQVVTGFDVDRSGRIAAVVNGKYDAPEIYLRIGSKLSRLTKTNDAFLASIRLASRELHSFASADGTSVDAFITRPAGAEGPLPAILDIHGGPVGQFNWGYDFGAQFFAANGYVVIQPNPRGSTGKGQSFINAIHGAWGVIDYDDVIAAVDHAIDLGYADPERLAVTGYSYGGYMTNVVITNTQRFRAAASGAGHSHIVANYGHDIYQKWYHWELGEPWQNSSGYARMSPLLRADKVSTPTIFLGGREDWNVPILSAELFYQMLRRRGIATRLVVYPDAHHSDWSDEFDKDYLLRIVGWFDSYAKGVEPASP